MEANREIEWIETVHNIIISKKSETYNPYPDIFWNIQEFKYFVEEDIDLISLVRNIWQQVKKKYNIQDDITAKLYVICIYFLCIKNYTDTLLTTPINKIFNFFKIVKKSQILRAEIDILEAIDYKFPMYIE